MRIGIFFELSKNQGGAYTYALTLLEALAKIPDHELVIISASSDIPINFRRLKKATFVDYHACSYKIAFKTRYSFSFTLAKITSPLVRILYHLHLYPLLTILYYLTLLPQIKTIEEQNLDLIFYPTSSNLSFLSKVPSVVAIHDLQHRLNPQFPEVSNGILWERREYVFLNINLHAYRILVDSPRGKKDMLHFYKNRPKRIVILPFLPSQDLQLKMPPKLLSSIKKRLKLPDHFVFYPANFWPHKMHLNLVRALELVNRQTPLHLVLTGSKDADFSTYKAVMKLSKKLGLQNKVKYLGYVNDKEFSALYKLAQALVMPTYFGPTNIPVLEAWIMGTPVIYSNVPGCKEQLGPAGLLINPNSPKSIAQQILKLLDNNKLKKELIYLGRQRVRRWTLPKFKAQIAQIITDFEKERHEYSDH